MSHLMGHGRYARETYPAGSPPTFGTPNEIVRYYFRIDENTPPESGTITYAPRPWTAADTALVTTQPPPLGPPPDFNFILPVPPCVLDRAALIIVTANNGNITGDDILVQWRGILGNDPVIAIPAPALGAQQTFIETNTVGALSGPTAVTIVNFDFSDVVVPLGGATIFPELLIPENLTVPSGSSLECFFAVGIDWNLNLINEPFGPVTP